MFGPRRPPFILTLLLPAVAAIYVAVLLGAREGGATGIGTASRHPSSFGGRVAREPAQMNVVDLSCWDREVQGPRSIGARYVRLTGRSCGQVPRVDAVSVRNLTNGFEATIFASGAGLTTDYIPLVVGANDVVIGFARPGRPPVERRLMLTR